MIRYPIRPRDWRNRIDAISDGWIDRARERTATFAGLGHYEESSSIWSEIKRVYMELQAFKCGFCERRLENSRFGNIEHDVEHFRPKKKVKGWPTSAIAEDRGIDYQFALGDAADPGYFLLPYHLENYLISCKTCNSALKANFFPVERDRETGGNDPRTLNGKVDGPHEKPLLIYPIGAVDQDPEKLITFSGLLPIPVSTGNTHDRRRATVTIDLFALDTREVLLQERAESVLALYLALETLSVGDAQSQEVARFLANELVQPRSPHANCARAFHDAWIDPATRPFADQIVDGAIDYLVSLP